MAIPQWFNANPLTFVVEVTANGYIVHPAGPYGPQDVISFDSKADFLYWVTANLRDPNAA